MQELLSVMLMVWDGCAFPPMSLWLKTEGAWWFKIDSSAVPMLETYWVKLTYALCEHGLVNTMLDVPFVEMSSLGILWISSLACIFSAQPEYGLGREIGRPSIPRPTTIAIGGPSGAGKTTLVRRLQKSMPGQVLTYPAYTTRPQRNGEVEGVDYHFRTDQDLALARLDPRFANFVEARGNWYWSNPSTFLRSAWRDQSSIHVLLVSQRKEAEKRRRLLPGMRWVWLDAEEPDVRSRLTRRGDWDVESSIDYNRKLTAVPIDDLIDLRINTSLVELDEVVQLIKTYCLNMREV